MFAKLLNALRPGRKAKTLAEQYPPTSPVRGPDDTVRFAPEYFRWTSAQQREWLQQVQKGPRP